MADIQGLELGRPGLWELATGPLDVTPEMLRHAAERATAAGASFRASLHLGHVDPRFDGEPALGWLHSLRIEGSGDDTVLLGDVTGMPDWLAELGKTAYPDRSIEGWAVPETDDLEITGLALLGVTPPGMSTIRSLRDIPAALGVAAGRVPVAASFASWADIAAGGVSDTPWSQFSDSDYSDEQYARACVLDRGVGAGTAKQRYSLPVREPSGALNRNGVIAAAGRIGSVTNASTEQKRAAARKLVSLYRSQLNATPPPGLLSAAGMVAASATEGLTVTFTFDQLVEFYRLTEGASRGLHH